MNKILGIRICTCFIRRNMSTPSTPGSAQTPGGGPNMTPRYRPSNLQKYILVWTKKFKSTEEVPTYVSPDLIQKASSQARIKIANILMILTALASLGAIIAGKSAAKRGESVHQMNLDWHQQYKDNYEKKQEPK